MMCRPCALNPKDKRRLQCILAGSIRAPHRLKRAGLMKSDKCSHPDCVGARVTTTHLFWECAKYQQPRQKYLDAIEAKKNFLRKHDKFALKAVNSILGNNCFRNTSICPGDKQQLLDTYAIDSFDPYRLGITADAIVKEDCVANMMNIDDKHFHKVYTDGSAIHGTSRELARAGWGVFYGPSSPHNHSSKLHGPTQTSYRAEVRALLHAVQTDSWNPDMCFY